MNKCPCHFERFCELALESQIPNDTISEILKRASVSTKSYVCCFADCPLPLQPLMLHRIALCLVDPLIFFPEMKEGSSERVGMGGRKCSPWLEALKKFHFLCLCHVKEVSKPSNSDLSQLIEEPDKDLKSVMMSHT